MMLDAGIGAGLESMTTNPMAWKGSVNPVVKKFKQAQNCLLPMSVTSENVAHCFGISRQEQDQAAVDIGVAKDLNAIVISFRGTQEHRFNS